MPTLLARDGTIINNAIINSSGASENFQFWRHTQPPARRTARQNVTNAG
jgi:hypothetical protein